MSVADAVRWPVGAAGDEDLSVILTVPKQNGRVEPRVKKRRPNQRLNEVALRFAARAEPTAQLTAVEREAYEEFIKILVESTN